MKLGKFEMTQSEAENIGCGALVVVVILAFLVSASIIRLSDAKIQRLELCLSHPEVEACQEVLTNVK